MFREDLQEAATAFGLTLSDEQVARFVRYEELLLAWNERMNLTAITEPREIAVKHIIDSLSAYDEQLFAGAPRVIDVGTGAGFPGLPLKIFAPQIHLTLMDSLGKRVKFLETVCEALGLTDVHCVHARAEEAARQNISLSTQSEEIKKTRDSKTKGRYLYREQFDLAVSRAVARLPVLLEYTLPFVKKGGTLLALKGRAYEEEIADASHALKVLGGHLIEARAVHLPGLDDRRAVLVIKKIAATPKAYPRKAGTPTKKPL